MKPDRRLLYLMVMGMEGTWLYALVFLLNKQTAGERLSVLGLLLLYPFAFGFNRLLEYRSRHRILKRVVSWVVWVGAMLLMVKLQLYAPLAWTDTTWLKAVPGSIPALIYSFRPELLVIIITGLVWWLGLRLANLTPTFALLVGEFQFGLVVLLGLFFIGTQVGASIAGAVPTALIFFSFALLGISIAHAHEGASWLSGLYRHRWSALLLVSIVVIIGLGLLLSLLVTPDLLQIVLDALKWLWGQIVKLIELIVSLLPKPGPAEMPTPLPQPGLELPPEQSNFFTIPEFWSRVIRIGWTVLVLGFLAFALWRISSQIFAWLRRRLATSSGAEIEPMRGAFKSDLISLLRWLLAGLNRLLSRPFRRRAPVSPEIASVRHIYRQLLRWAATRGLPRHFSQTPDEYLSTLVGWLPELEPDFNLITRQYVRVRYGPFPPAESELNHLRQSWHNIKQIGTGIRDRSRHG